MTVFLHIHSTHRLRRTVIWQERTSHLTRWLQSCLETDVQVCYQVPHVIRS